jgi:hypothetical protein
MAIKTPAQQLDPETYLCTGCAEYHAPHTAQEIPEACPPSWAPLWDFSMRHAEINPSDYMAMFATHSGHIHVYKHIETRRCLNLDAQGNCYRFRQASQFDAGYEPQAAAEAIAHVLG